VKPETFTAVVLVAMMSGGIFQRETIGTPAPAIKGQVFLVNRAKFSAGRAVTQ
jgi:hypothetical protein